MERTQMTLKIVLAIFFNEMLNKIKGDFQSNKIRMMEIIISLMILGASNAISVYKSGVFLI